MQILRALLHASVCARRRRVHAAEACRLRAARRAGCASQDAPVARRKTRRFAHRKTRRLHAARRAGCTPEGVPGARRVHAVRAPCKRASRASRPVRPFSSRSGPLELRGLFAGGRRHARRGPQEHRASPALLRALAKLEPQPGRAKVVALRGCVLSCFGRYARRSWSPEKAERKKTAKTPPEPEGNIWLPFLAETHKVPTRFGKKQSISEVKQVF